MPDAGRGECRSHRYGAFPNADIAEVGPTVLVTYDGDAAPHKAFAEQIAGQIIVCDSGALCTIDYAKIPYRYVSRPIYPLDQI